MAIQTSTPRLAAEINVTPMIDVLLVLLVIFMLITPSVRRALYTSVIDDTGDESLSTVPTLTVEARPGARYALAGAAAGSADAGLTQGALRVRLAEWRRGVPDGSVVVKGAEEVRYDDVFRALDAARGAGVERVALAPKVRAP